MKRSISTAVILLTLSACGASPEGPSAGDPHPAATAPSVATIKAPHLEAATASMKTLGRLVTPGKLLGFESKDAADSATLAEALPMFLVRLDQLRSYRGGDDPHALLVDQGSVLYPVVSGGKVQSSVVLRNVGGEWKPAQFGRPMLAKTAHEHRHGVGRTRGVPESSVTLVNIPAVSAHLIGHDENGVLMLTALVDVPETDIRAGVTLRATDVFAKLQPLAAANDGSRPN